jgi:hypothetical protein
MTTAIHGPADAGVGDPVEFKPDINRDRRTRGKVVAVGKARLTVETTEGQRVSLAYTYRYKPMGFHERERDEPRFRKLDASDLWWEAKPKVKYSAERDGVLRVEARAWNERRDEVIAELDALAAWLAAKPRKEQVA